MNSWDLLEPHGETTISTWQVADPADSTITNYYRQVTWGTNVFQLTFWSKKSVPIVNSVPTDGLLVLSKTEGLGSVTQATYYTDYPTNALTGSANRLEREDDPDSAWNFYLYDSMGRVMTDF